MAERGSGLLGAALTLIHTGRAPTRSALTAALGVTRATAGAVIADLRDLGLIQVGAGSRGGAQGRPSHRLVIDPEGPVALAGQVHPDGFAVALVGLGGQVVARTSWAAPVPDDPAQALAPVAGAAAELLRRSARSTWAGRPGRRSGTPSRACWPTARSACRPGWSTTSTRSRWPSTGTGRAGTPSTCWSSPPSTGASAARWCCTARCTPAAAG